MIVFVKQLLNRLKQVGFTRQIYRDVKLASSDESVVLAFAFSFGFVNCCYTINLVSQLQ